MNKIYQEMIQAYTKGENAKARELAIKFIETGTKNVSKLRDAFHILKGE